MDLLQPNEVGTPNKNGVGQQQQLSSPQSVVPNASGSYNGQGPSSSTIQQGHYHQQYSNPNNSGYQYDQQNSVPTALTGAFHGNVSTQGGELINQGFHHPQTHGQPQAPVPPNHFTFQKYEVPQPNFDQPMNVSPLAFPAAAVNPMDPTSTMDTMSVQQQQPMGVSPPFSNNTTPTGQIVKTPQQPTAPKKASRPNHYNHQVAPDTIDSVHRNRTRSGSIESSSTQSSDFQAEYTGDILHDPTFAPPPKFPENLSVVKMRFFGDEKNLTVKSTLPSFEQVNHSGECMARFSLRSMIIKKWRQCFWIAYGNNQILFFRSKVDFEEWVSNPYLSKTERDALVKLNVDFVNDLYKPSVNGYNPTNIRAKSYNRNGALHHFKLERWLDYGPIIAGAFASKNQNDVYCLRRLMCEMIERSPQRKKKSGYNSSASSAYDSDGQSVRSAFSRHSNASAKTVITVRSAPATMAIVNNGGTRNNAFSSRATRAKSVEPPKRRRRNRFGRKEKSDQTADEWRLDPGTAFTMRKADVDYAL